MESEVADVNRVFPVAVVVCVVAACNPPARAGQDRASLDSILREHVNAVNSRNADAVLESVTDDIIYLAPQAPPVSGRDSLEAVLRPAYEEFQPRITMTPQEVEIHGDVAVEWGCLGGELQPLDGGDPIPNEGKYLLVYERQETLGWKIARDVYNTGPCGPNQEGDRPWSGPSSP